MTSRGTGPPMPIDRAAGFPALDGRLDPNAIMCANKQSKEENLMPRLTTGSNL